MSLPVCLTDGLALAYMVSGSSYNSSFSTSDSQIVHCRAPGCHGELTEMPQDVLNSLFLLALLGGTI